MIPTDRLRTAGVLALVLALAIAPVTGLVAADVMLSPGGSALIGGQDLAPSALDRPAEAISYGAGPGWAVKVDTNDSDAVANLREWANSSTDRRLVAEPGDGGWAVVAAPSGHIGVGLLDRALGNGLATAGYVEAVEAELTLTTMEIDSVERESQLTFRERSALGRTLGAGSLSSIPDGVATRNETRETTMAENRAIIGVDNVSATGAGVTVAVVDSGANTADGTVFGNGTSGSDIRITDASKNFLTNETVDAATGDYTAIEDGNGHGSHVASTIAANTSNATHDGVAPDANLLVLKALSDDGSGSSADIANAIRYAADQDADVISLSLGSPLYSEQIADAVAYARDQGSVVLIATGNSRSQGRAPAVASPADTPLDGVISVGAANVPENGTSAAVPAHFSQGGPDPGTTDLSNGVTQGAGVDVVGPGTKIVAKTPTTSGTVRSTTLSGTSMAQPHAAGVAALLVDDGVTDPATIEARLSNDTRVMPKATVAFAGGGYLAADRALANESSDQAAARTDEAVARDQAWQAISDSQGGGLARAFDGLAGAVPEV